MNIHLRNAITYDVVGDHMVFLNPDTQVVYSLPADVIAHISGTTVTLRPDTPASYLAELEDAGLITTQRSNLSRRQVLAGTGAVAGAGLVAMSLPGVAAASSNRILPTINAQWWTDNSVGDQSYVIYVRILQADVPEVTADNFLYDTRNGEWSVDATFGNETVNLNYAYANNTPYWVWNNNYDGDLGRNEPPIESGSAIYVAVNTVRGNQQPVAITGVLRRNNQPFANLAIAWQSDFLW